MGVYIDIEMPKGELGAIPIMIYANGNVEHFFSHEKYGKAIEVPAPHGRLIDADALIDKILGMYSFDNGFRFCMKGILLSAPAVISASLEEGKDV